MAINVFRIAAVAGTSIAASANAQLVTIDLTVVDQITITATTEASAATVTGSDSTGIYLEGFYSVAGASIFSSSGTGDFTNFLNPADNTPGIFRSASDNGLNFWTWSSDFDVDFVAGTQAFTGSAVFSLDATQYAEAIAGGNRSGNLWFPADTNDDLTGATQLGTYNVIVPAPASAALLGLGGLVAARRRR